MGIFDARESAVRSYCRTWPAVFDRAARQLAVRRARPRLPGFLRRGGALNYGHNNPVLKGRCWTTSPTTG